MFEKLGHAVVRRRRLTLVLFAVGVIAAGVLSSGLFSRLQAAGFDDPGSDSVTVSTALADRFGVTDPTAVLAVETLAGVDDDATARAATALVGRVAARPGVSQVVSYWTSGRPASLRSTDGRTGQVIVLTAPDADRTAVATGIRDAVGGRQGDLTVHVGGGPMINKEIAHRITSDLGRAESIAIPLTTVLLIVVFGSLVAAGLPFLVAAGSILGAFLVLFVISLATDVSVFALNLVTGLGLGLGIDYALLVVNRFREELAADPATATRGAPDVEAAVVRTVATAGRTVFVSGLTVAVTLAALLAFPQYFLRSFGYAGIAVTLLAVLSALVALPAVLAMLGGNVNRWRVARGDLTPRDSGIWSWVSRRVMRSPWPVIAVVLAGLSLVASPARDAVFGQVDERALPADAPVAVASAVLRDRFPGREGSPVDVIVPGGAGDAAGVAAYAERLSRVPDVVRVSTPSDVVAAGARTAANPDPQRYTAGGDVRLSVIADVNPRSPEGQDLVDGLRAVPAPAGTMIGGAAALYTDSQHGITSMLPLVLAWIVLTTLVVLFLFTGSVLLPLKAVVLNVVSLGATVGALVWVFQQGHLRSLVGDFTVTGTLDTSMMVLISITAFALSMDYEVFLLSRIKEEHDAGHDTTEAVALGLQRSGRIITAAAALLAIVFVSFISSGVTNIKQLGLGVAFAIVVDATVVRGLLVPALMRTFGRGNWWAPRPLRAVHRRFGLSEATPATEPRPVPSPSVRV
jgi:putative drug exporter of the RND superfamily